MRILLITDVFVPRRGGTEIIFYEIFKRLINRGHSVTVITPRIKGTKELEVIDGFKVNRIYPSNRLIFVFKALKKSLELAKNSDIIQTAVWFGGYLSVVTKIFSRRPCVLMVNAFFNYKWFNIRNPVLALLFASAEKLLFSLPFDKFICLSKSQEKLLISNSIDKDKIDVIYPGINFDLFKPKDSKKLKPKNKLFRYCFYGRYDPQKGIEILLKSAKIFSQKYPESRLILIVSGRHNLRHLIDKLNLKDNVILLEGRSQKELVDIINDVDVVVVPSKVEPFGMVAAEASALMKPVIVSNIDGLKEIVVDGETGFLVDTPKEMVEKLILLYKNRELKNKIGVKGREYVKKFNWDNAAKKYEKIYKNVLRQSKCGENI
jgi:phosphatidylinositol alpha-mannosyltransferase